MIIYLDSSAVVKLYVTEEHHDYTEALVRRVGWANVGIVAVSAIVYPEVSAALAAMTRAGRITPEHHESAMDKLRHDLSRLYLVRPVTGAVIERAVALPAAVLGTPGKHKLKGYDAVQLATALELRDEAARRAGRGEPEEVLVLTFDRDLHDAAVAEDIAHSHPGRAGGRMFPVPWSRF